TGKDNVSGDSIGNSQSHKPRQFAIGKVEDNKDNEPDAEDAEPKDNQTLQKAFQQSHDSAAVAVVMAIRHNLPQQVCEQRVMPRDLKKSQRPPGGDLCEFASNL